MEKATGVASTVEDNPVAVYLMDLHAVYFHIISASWLITTSSYYLKYISNLKTTEEKYNESKVYQKLVRN
jgi:hypothetical protein